jgi:uncharacterized protein (DUF2336 family)
MNAGQSLIPELEDALHSGSKDRRVDTLRRITDLFVADADRYNDQQIAVFDNVLGQLIEEIEGKALAELSGRLGSIANAPIDVVRRLASDDDITIAEPILAQSRRLSDNDLIEIANTKTQGHLLAISGRAEIGANVTDVLLRRGERHVIHKLAENSSASFSENGFATLVSHSQHDEQLAEKVGLRRDVPLPLFRELLLRATEAVRSRLLAQAGPENRDKIRRVLGNIAEDAQHEAAFQNDRDYAAAHARILEMQRQGRLNEALLFELATADRYADMIAALSLLCGAPMQLIEGLLHSEHSEAWLIPCKVANLDWRTVRIILTCGSIKRTMSDQTLDSARADYYKLSQASSARVLRFWQVRKSAANDVATPAMSPTSKPQISRSRTSTVY